MFMKRFRNDLSIENKVTLEQLMMIWDRRNQLDSIVVLQQSLSEMKQLSE